MSEDGYETDTEEILNKNLELIININNQMVKTINYLEKINAEICKMVSNIGNMEYMIELKAKDELNKRVNGKYETSERINKMK